MSNRNFQSAIAAFIYEELQNKVSVPTLAFVCNSVDAASLDARLNDPREFPRGITTVSLAQTISTDTDDPRRHYTVDLFDKQLIPIGSIRVYLEGDCRLLRDASEETMIMYKARIGLL